MQTQTATIIDGKGRSKAIGKSLQLVGAFLLGGAIVFGAGFVNTAAVHNAAHDTRHSQGFPCH